MEIIRKTALEITPCCSAQTSNFSGRLSRRSEPAPCDTEDRRRLRCCVGHDSEHEFDAISLDWYEISDLGDFLSAVDRSNLNHECILVAIVRDLLDLRQAFAGVHFLIHKPASVVQIDRCLRAAVSSIENGSTSQPRSARAHSHPSTESL